MIKKLRIKMLKLTIGDMQQLATFRGGKCLSKDFKNNTTTLRWECKKGHVWEAIPKSIRRGSWCPSCAGRRKTIDDMRAFAKRKGGDCLSEKYIRGDVPLRWKCSKGHIWEAKPQSVLHQTSWCHICSKRQRYTLDDMIALAKERGGRCLSKKYANVFTKMKWECSQKHRWSVAATGVIRGSWCPKCDTSFGEELTRAFFEALFNTHFPSAWPDWLRSAKGHVLELDGYNEPLKLAFEHQGSHHYSTSSSFIFSDEDLKNRRATDRRKRYLCRKLGVRLIAVPQVPRYQPIQTLESFIRKKCHTLGVTVPLPEGELRVNWKKVYCPDSQRYLEELRNLARARNGKLLSDRYLGMQTKLRWQCDDGHEWAAQPASIKAGTWCAFCSTHPPASIADMHELAARYHGRCLSKIYKNATTKIKWECEFGHRWKSLARNVKADHWCPRCGGRQKYTLKEMQQFARQLGGACLSNEYLGISEKLKWKCAQGHIWDAPPAQIVGKHWCLACAAKERGRKRRLTIEEMHEIAASREGKCLSKEYLTAQTHLEWECKKGHKWWAKPNNIKNGKWCPFCFGRGKTIVDMKRLATEREGCCLSEEYFGMHAKLRWQCEKKHVWEATPAHILHGGTWCPFCVGRKP